MAKILRKLKCNITTMKGSREIYIYTHTPVYFLYVISLFLSCSKV